ncbi:DUF5615 family PIN-like protein [soil metagenome]
MTLLFDENLSRKLVRILAAEIPNCSHIEVSGMRGATVRAVWDFTADHGFTIVSKDNDFRQRVFLNGPPPKVIWLAVGNAGTQEIAELLRHHIQRIESFHANAYEGLLVLRVDH